MRTVVMLAAMLAGLAMAPQPAEAGDRGFGFRHFSGHGGAQFHRPHHGFKFHRRSLFGQHRQFEPRHFDHFGHGGLVLRFGDFGFELSHVSRLKRHHFDPRHGHGGLIFRFGSRGTWRHGSPAASLSAAPQHFERFESSFPGFRRIPRGAQGGVPPEAILRRLEELGFRHVPTLLRERIP